MDAKFTVERTSRFTEEERKLRAEARRLVSMANKRLRRLEQQNLLNSPAYKKWVEDGGQKFSVKGKSMEEVKQEVARMNDFLKMQTSTVRGAKQYFKNVAKEVGIKKVDDFTDLQKKLNKFFETTAKIKEYLYNSKEIGVAIGYQKIWEVVSDYVEEVGDEVELTEETVLEMIGKLVGSVTHSEMDRILDKWIDELS
jgi:hypothetical protein